jgi:uncharacterized protein
MVPGDFLNTTSITGPAGAIEIATALPAQTPLFLAIVCHPHSLFGGAMGNKVVTTVERTLRDLHSATVRFNFRGVGKSAGQFDHGLGECLDLTAAYQFARSYYPELPLLLAGFSFGSYVAARMANSLNAGQLILIAPPVQSWDFRALDAPRMPWCIVQGEQDEVVQASAVYQFASEQNPAHTTLLRLPNCTHFFHGKLAELRAALSAELAEKLGM